MNFLSKIFLTAWMAIGSIFGYQDLQQQPVSYGAFNPTGGATYRLQSSVSSTQTTITLSSFKEPVSNIPYTMSYLNSDIMYGTINPQNNNNKEFVSFTGITQNANGSATLTGVTRGLGFSYPYTASTTLRQAHSGQSIFILSNTPQLYNQYANKNNDQSISGIWDFSTYLPTTSISATSSNQFANKAYVDSVAIAGAPNSTESVKGIGELATQIEMASSTLTGSTGASLLLYSKYSTSSPYTTGLYVPITRNDGKLNPNFIATTSSDVYRFGGKIDMNSNASTTGLSAGYAYFGTTATSSFSNTGVLTLATTTTGNLKTSSSGIVYTAPTTRYVLIDNTDLGVTGGASAVAYATSTAQLFIPANTLSASSTISINFALSPCTDNDADGNPEACTFYLRDSNGNTFFSGGMASPTAGASNAGFANVVVGSNNSNTFSSQISGGNGYYVTPGTPSTGSIIAPEQTSTIDFTQNVTLKIVTSATSNATFTIYNYQIIVNP